MFYFTSFLKNSRTELGLSQIQLAHLSGISLPTIQNIEANKANPSLETLLSLTESLGLEVKIQPKLADWEFLVYMGLPLTQADSKREMEVDIPRMILAVHTSCAELIHSPNGTGLKDHERKLEATQAFLLAIQLHFPSFFRKNFEKSPRVQQILPKKLSGRIIKLKRLALSRIAEYL